jgi:flagellar biosynthesis/type III secretory pathway protein FliH
LIYELKNDSVELSYERVSQRGLTKGFTKGLTKGFTKGLTKGFTKGLTKGFTKGLTKGVRTKLIKLASSAPHTRRSVKREVLI